MSVEEVVKAWCKGVIDTPTALARGNFDGFADLLGTAIGAGVPLRKKLTEREKRQAQVFVQLVQGAEDEPSR